MSQAAAEAVPEATTIAPSEWLVHGVSWGCARPTPRPTRVSAHTPGPAHCVLSAARLTRVPHAVARRDLLQFGGSFSQAQAQAQAQAGSGGFGGFSGAQGTNQHPDTSCWWCVHVHTHLLTSTYRCRCCPQHKRRPRRKVAHVSAAARVLGCWLLAAVVTRVCCAHLTSSSMYLSDNVFCTCRPCCCCRLPSTAGCLWARLQSAVSVPDTGDTQDMHGAAAVVRAVRGCCQHTRGAASNTDTDTHTHTHTHTHTLQHQVAGAAGARMVAGAVGAGTVRIGAGS
jgi:hypothetical protein